MTITDTMPSSNQRTAHRRVSYVPPERTRADVVTSVVATVSMIGAVAAIGAMLLMLSLIG